MEPWDLVFEHRYDEAAAIYERMLSVTPDDKLVLAAHGTALLCMGRLHEALSDFQRANSLDQEESGGESSGYSVKLALIHWLLGEHYEAMNVLWRILDDLRIGRVQFADLAGGASPGMLLWYMALEKQNSGMHEFALTFLDGLTTKRSLAGLWPGILALFALGRADFNDVLRDIGETQNLGRIRKRARKDLYVRRQLCKAHFYLGVKYLAISEEGEYLRQLAECTALENPIIEPEWYIARAVTAKT